MDKFISPIGDDWDDIRQTLLSPEERAQTDMQVAVLMEKRGEYGSVNQNSAIFPEFLSV